MPHEMSQPTPKWLLRLTVIALFFVVARNLLPPNAFTATVLLFDYEFGLIRRGVFGELGNLFWGETVSRSEVFLLSLAITISGVTAAIALFMHRMPTTLAGSLLLLLIFSSFTFSAIVASTGYIDLALICLVCLALWTPSSTFSGIVIRVLVCAVGMLMHEVMLPYFTIFFAFDIWISRNKTQNTMSVIVSVLPLIAGIATLMVLTKWGQLPAAEIPVFLEYIDLKSEFAADPEATVVMERTITDNLQVMADKRHMADYRAWVLLDGIPLFLMMLWVIWLNFKLLGAQAGLITRLLLLGAILAPLSLNVIAFDVVRFGAISVFVGFLAIASQMRVNDGAQERLAEVMSWPLFVCVLLVNLNVAVNQLNTGEGHQYLFPWVLVEHLGWL